MELHKIWIEQCEAARSIEDEFGEENALTDEQPDSLVEGHQ